MWETLFTFLSFWFYAWFSLLLLVFHAVPLGPSDFSSSNGRWSLCQLTASHFKCLPYLSAFLPSLLGREQADCSGTLSSSGLCLLEIHFSVFCFPEGHKVSLSIWVPFAQIGNLSCCGLSVSFKSPQVGPSLAFVFMVFRHGALRYQD